jgi:hypothetical protein
MPGTTAIPPAVTSSIADYPDTTTSNASSLMAHTTVQITGTSSYPFISNTFSGEPTPSTPPTATPTQDLNSKFSPHTNRIAFAAGGTVIGIMVITMLLYLIWLYKCITFPGIFATFMPLNVKKKKKKTDRKPKFSFCVSSGLFF